MERVQEVLAHWAWYGKEPGSLQEYGVLHCSGGAGKRHVFDGYIKTSAPGNPPAGGRGNPDRLPWITVNGLTSQGERWVAVSAMEPSEQLDGSGRLITPTRFFMVPYDQIAPWGATYLTLWRAVEAIVLPPAGNPTTVPVVNLPDDQASSLIGLGHIADSLRTPATGTQGVNRLTAAAHWAASVAAGLLSGEPVVITRASRLGPHERLTVLDAVAGFLPYGVRSDLAVGNCMDGMRRPRTRLAFGPPHTPHARKTGLGEPLIGHGLAREYGETLRRLIDSQGHEAVLRTLSGLREPLQLTDHARILGSLAHLDLVRHAVAAVDQNRGTPDLVAQALNSKRNGEPPSQGQEVLYRFAVQHVDDSPREPLRDHWHDPQTSHDVTVHVVEELLATPEDLAAHLDSGCSAGRQQLLWQFVTQCRKDDEVLRALIDRCQAGMVLEPTDHVVELLRTLGPEALRSGGPASHLVLREAPRLTQALLYAEAGDVTRLGAWLDYVRPWGQYAQPWLRAWMPLAAWDDQSGPLAPMHTTPDSPDDAVLVLAAAAKSGPGSAGRVSSVVRYLWKALLNAAKDERNRVSPPPQASRSLLGQILGRRSDRASDHPPEAGPPASAVPDLGQLLDEPQLWAECRARADVLRCLAGRPLTGPPSDARDSMRYRDEIADLYFDEYLRRDLHLFAEALAELVLRDEPRQPGGDLLLSVLGDAPVRRAREAVAARVASWEADHGHAEPEPEPRAEPEPEPQADPPATSVTWSPSPASSPATSLPPSTAADPRVPTFPLSPAEEWDRLDKAVGKRLRAFEIAQLWAPVAVSSRDHDALVRVGRWWEGADVRDRDALLHELEKALVVQGLCRPSVAREVVHEFRVWIVSEQASTPTGGGWHGKEVLGQEKKEFKERRGRFRALRRARWRSHFPWSPRSRSKHSRRRRRDDG
ncbi:hypothetical protein [Streptomyces sp. NPDC051219]|uniref:hypothetical protein n=1 Tax=Streptomyces sp. NPDC051219 TaxID=3155283 RepID=UPI00342D1237